MVLTASPTPAAPLLYTIAVVPDYGDKDFRRQQYGAWYVSHWDEDALTPERLQALFDQGCAAGVIAPQTAEAMAEFAVYLETQGYTVQQTASEGYVVIATGALGAEEAGDA
jgi:hypothetical protein